MDPEDLDFNDAPSDEAAPRLDLEWAVASAIRDVLGIAIKGLQEPTYAQAIAVGKEIIPGVLGVGSLLGAQAEQPDVRLYRERAESESTRQGQEVTPEQLITADIEYLESLIAETPDKPAIERQVRKLERLRFQLEPRPMSEHQIIQRDAFTARHELPAIPFPEVDHIDYRLPKGKGLRIRVLHPDRAEAATGADVIYEMYSDHKQTARIVALQYKIWDRYALYFSEAPSLEAQLRKLEATVGGTGLCADAPNGVREKGYRLPFCTAFLRPTDKLQSPDARLISSGLHLPVCAVFRQKLKTRRGGSVLRRKFFRREAVTHKAFEELFNIGMLGSRWLTYRELESFYQASSILKPGQRILLHAQELTIAQ